MLGKILGLLTNRLLLTIAGLVLLLALVWFGSEYVGLEEYRLWILIGLAVAVGLFLLVQRMLIARSARKMEESLRSQGDEQRANVLPSQQGEIEALGQQFEDALTALKKSKGGRGALYAFPWYVIIGPPGSGKSTLINESNLNLPYMKHGRGEIRGVGGTRNCDWFFTDQAILLDTAGRYMTGTEDREEWLAFLQMLEQGRKRQPINGVIIAISIPEIIEASDTELDKHAENIRNRLDELTRNLNAICPVYLIFTKCDLLDGFVEFFGGFSKEERSQVWGCTVDPDPAGKTSFAEAFHAGFEDLFERVCSERIVQLSPDRPSRKRQKIHAFPLQLALARQRLGQLIDAIAQPNPFQETAFFRGFYFSSGTQEGRPIDVVTSAVGEAMGIASAGTAGAVETQKQCYFINDLFTRVMFPDQHLAHRTAKIERRRRWGRMLSMRGSIVAAALVFVGMGYSAMTGCSEIKGSNSIVTAFKASATTNAGESVLSALFSMSRHIEALSDSSFSFGLARTRQLRRRALNNYIPRFKEAFIIPTSERLAAEINATISRWLTELASDEKFSPEKAEETEFRGRLAVFRSISGAKTSIETGQLRSVLSGHGIWSFQYKVDPNGYSKEKELGPDKGGTENLSNQRKIDAQRDFLVDVLAPDSTLTSEWRCESSQLTTVERNVDRILKRVNIAYGLYSRAISKMGESDRGLEDLLSNDLARHLDSSERIPSCFFEDRRADYESERGKAVQEHVEGLSRTGTPVSAARAAELAAEIDLEFKRNSDEAWERFLSGIAPQGFVSVASTKRKIPVLAEKDGKKSPYLMLFHAIDDMRPGVEFKESDKLADLLVPIDQLHKAIVANLDDKLSLPEFDPKKLRDFFNQLEHTQRDAGRLAGEVRPPGDSIVRTLLGRVWDKTRDAVKADFGSALNYRWNELSRGLDGSLFPWSRDAKDQPSRQLSKEIARRNMTVFVPETGELDRFFKTVRYIKAASGVTVEPDFPQFEAAVKNVQDALFDREANEWELTGRIKFDLERGKNLDDFRIIQGRERWGYLDNNRLFIFIWRFDQGPMTIECELGTGAVTAKIPGLSKSQSWGLFRFVAAGSPEVSQNDVRCEWRLIGDDEKTHISALVSVDRDKNPFKPGFFDALSEPPKFVCPEPPIPK